VQHDQSDDRGEPDVHVPEANDEVPHSHVCQLAASTWTELLGSEAVEEEHLARRRAELGQDADQRSDLGHAVQDALPVVLDRGWIVAVVVAGVLVVIASTVTGRNRSKMPFQVVVASPGDVDRSRNSCRT